MMNKSKEQKAKGKRQRSAAIALIFALCFLLFAFNSASAQTPVSNPNSTGFKIVICDGPAGINIKNDPKFIACDFNGMMKQVQHLIDIMLVLGVFVAIGLMCYAGYLYISGSESNIEKAKSIFPKIFIGFIIMLSAWFIVYQVLGWLIGNADITKLLGKP